MKTVRKLYGSLIKHVSTIVSFVEGVFTFGGSRSPVAHAGGLPLEGNYYQTWISIIKPGPHGSRDPVSLEAIPLPP